MAHLRTSNFTAHTTIVGAEEKSYEKLDEAIATYLCLPTATGWKVKVAHLFKPCKTTSVLAGHAYTSAGQAGSALHTMTILQDPALRRHPDPSGRKSRGLSLAVAGPTPKQPRVCLPTLRSVPGVESNVCCKHWARSCSLSHATDHCYMEKKKKKNILRL